MKHVTRNLVAALACTLFYSASCAARAPDWSVEALIGEALSISHGFNIVAVSRAYALHPWQFRFGPGPVIAHPEARIGEASYDGDYELAGAAAVGSAGAMFALTPQLSVVGEATATFAYVNVHPKGEPTLTFSVRNPAIHARVGLAYRF
jgi:hypothetical protein